MEDSIHELENAVRALELKISIFENVLISNMPEVAEQPLLIAN